MTTINAFLNNGQVGDTVTVEGWIQTSRGSKDVHFLALTDGSCMAPLQLVVESRIENFSHVKKWGVGSGVRATGHLVESIAKGQRYEVQTLSISLVGDVAKDYPLQKKRHSFEFLRTIAHLRPRARTFGAVFRMRHVLQAAVHRYFDEHGFFQVHTPIITGSDCEGAGQMFRVTTLDPLTPPLTEGRVDYTRDFFHKETSLTVSGQLEGEIFAHALKNIYTFGPTFRAENSNTARHASEFWMIEPEMAFCDLQGNQRVAESFIKYLISSVLQRCQDEVDFFDQWIENGLRHKLETLVTSNFETMTYTEAVSQLIQSGESFAFPVEWGKDLQSEHERYLTEKRVGNPIFVVDYPRDIKAFYMRLNDDDKTVAAMDLLVPRVGEIIGGSQREERLDVLDNQLAHFGLDKDQYWWYRDLRRFGGVPHAGFGLGFERALMYVTGMQNIRDVIPFPRTPGNADF